MIGAIGAVGAVGAVPRVGARSCVGTGTSCVGGMTMKEALMA